MAPTLGPIAVVAAVAASLRVGPAVGEDGGGVVAQQDAELLVDGPAARLAA
jgi:hypothetical protein